MTAENIGPQESAPARQARPDLEKLPWLDRLLTQASKHTLARAVILALIIASGALLWWSFSLRLPLMKQSAADIQKVTLLQNELIQLEQDWPQDAASQLALQARSARQLVLNGYDSVAIELEKLKNLADSMGLRLQYTLLPAQPATPSATHADDRADAVFGNIKRLPLELKLSIGDRPDSFTTLLSFIKKALDRPFRLELTRLSMMRDQQHYRAELMLRLWTRLDGPATKVGKG